MAKAFTQTATFGNNKDLSADFTSEWVSAESTDLIAIILDFTGTPTGTFTIEAAINQDATPVALDFGAPITASGSADKHAIEIANFPYNFIRVRYTATSGAGSLDYQINRKAV